jgi:hypothetical protein
MVTSRPGYDSIVLLTDCPLPRLIYILASLRPYGGKLSLLSVSLKQRRFSPFPSPISLSWPLEWDCHRQIFGRETLSDLTAKSSAIEMRRGLQVLYDAYSQDSVAL